MISDDKKYRHYCVSCGAPLPHNQGSRVCSVCYGDPWHGRDGYLLRMMEEDAARQDYARQQQEQSSEDV